MCFQGLVADAWLPAQALVKGCPALLCERERPLLPPYVTIHICPHVKGTLTLLPG